MFLYTKKYISILIIFAMLICLILYVSNQIQSFSVLKDNDKPYNIEKFTIGRDLYYQEKDKVCRFYFYDVENNKKVYEERNIKGGEKFIIELVENIDIPPRNTTILCPSLEIYVLSCSIKNDKILLDIDSDIIKKLNFTDEYEKIYLETVVNTLCYALNKSEIIITLNGKNYKSDNIYMIDGQSFKENFNDYTNLN